MEAEEWRDGGKASSGEGEESEHCGYAEERNKGPAGTSWQVVMRLNRCAISPSPNEPIGHPAHVAQLVEHVLGKDEVTRSIRVVGSITRSDE